ncbi:uncharacterized protein PgNI_03329, partial [Pyricularia grisea]|uniref:Uncharacterized protein n=1 Tax=Pyricularia grisea TaxID=148305 RepID=A0A6P8BDJ8_PYRGI
PDRSDSRKLRRQTNCSHPSRSGSQSLRSLLTGVRARSTNQSIWSNNVLSGCVNEKTWIPTI